MKKVDKVYPIGAKVYISPSSSFSHQIRHDPRGEQLPLYIVGIRLGPDVVYGRFDREDYQYMYATAYDPGGDAYAYYNNHDLYGDDSSTSIQNSDIVFLLEKSFYDDSY